MKPNFHQALLGFTTSVREHPLAYAVFTILQLNNSLAGNPQTKQAYFICAQQNPPERGTPPTKEGTGSRLFSKAFSLVVFSFCSS
jgi:hypothetical protein